MNKQNKISELEKLQLKRIRYQAEADIHAHALDNHINYLQNHFGSILMNTALTAVKSKLPPAIRVLIPGTVSDKAETLPATKQLAGSYSVLNTVADYAIDLVPMFFKGSKPVIIAFILKQIKDFLIKKK